MPINVYKTVRARELFNKIVHQAHHNGEPGMLFLDAANRSNPVPHLYQLEATNPCGEQWLGPYENCCLGSINLAEHWVPMAAWIGRQLRKSVELSTIFLDDVVEANAYVPAVPQLGRSRPPRPPHRPGDYGPGRLDVSCRHPLWLRRRSGVRRSGDGIRALSCHAHQHRAGRRARRFPGHSRQPLRPGQL